MRNDTTLSYQFGPFQFHLSQRLLKRDAEIIPLPPKATDILLMLLSNAGNLVEKDLLMKHVWPDSFVEEGNLSQNIFTLRRALGDQRSQIKYIETVTRRGYRFIAEVNLVERYRHAEVDLRMVCDTRNSSQAQSVVMILPLVNATGDSKLEQLADEIVDNVISHLSQIPHLRVISGATAFRYKGQEIDHKLVASQLGVSKMIVGKITLRGSVLSVAAELLDPNNGWMLRRSNIERSVEGSLGDESTIAFELFDSFRPALTESRESPLVLRYTENSRSYLEYTKGRFHGSKFTSENIQKAIHHFSSAIRLDPNYALPHWGIVDCYLRLTTNYLPPSFERILMAAPEILGQSLDTTDFRQFESSDTSASKVRLRFEWDWKNAERELRRTSDLRSENLAAHQWEMALRFIRDLYLRSRQGDLIPPDSLAHNELPKQIRSAKLTSAEEVQIFCAIAREQIDVGNYSAACRILTKWWEPGSWPKVNGLDIRSSADLLFTAGEAAGFVASATQLPNGQKNAEALLSGAIVLFQQLGAFLRTSESRIELALCYYRQGRFDLGKSALIETLEELDSSETELRCLALVRLASLERHAGKLSDALNHLTQAATLVDDVGPWVSGRLHLEFGATYKDLAAKKKEALLFNQSYDFHLKSIREFEAIGNLRLLGIARNNLGFMLLTEGQVKRAVPHLLTAWSLFEQLGDKVRRAQVDDTIARLLVSLKKHRLAQRASNRAVEVFENGDEDALFAEVLTTKGFILCKLNKNNEAIMTLERAYGIAARCGDREGATKALLTIKKELETILTPEQKEDIRSRLNSLCPP